MVCAGDLRLSFLYSLVHSAFSRTRALTRRAMGFLDCRFCTSTHLGGRATQSRLATAQLAADPGNRYPVPLRDLFRGRNILAQTLWVQPLLYTMGGTLAEGRGGFHHSRINADGNVNHCYILKPVPHLGATTRKPHRDQNRTAWRRRSVQWHPVPRGDTHGLAFSWRTLSYQLAAAGPPRAFRSVDRILVQCGAHFPSL